MHSHCQYQPQDRLQRTSFPGRSIPRGKEQVLGRMQSNLQIHLRLPSYRRKSKMLQRQPTVQQLDQLPYSLEMNAPFLTGVSKTGLQGMTGSSVFPNAGFAVDLQYPFIHF